MVRHPEQLEDAALNLFGRLPAESWIKSIESERSVNLMCLPVIVWST